MPFWSKSQEKPASEPGSEPVPEPTDEPKPDESEASSTAPATKDAPTPEDEVKAPAPSESTWGSRFNTAKQLYGTANQVYTVASAVPQARTALEPYLTKASTTEDPESKAEPVAKATDSTQETSDIAAQHEKGISDLQSAEPLVDEIPSSETLARPGEESEIEDDATRSISEFSPEGESAREPIAAKDIPYSRDEPASDLVSGSDDKEEASAGSPAASKTPDIEADTTNVGTEFTKSLDQPEEVKTVEDSSSSGVASQSNVNAQDAESLHPETTSKAEAPEASDLDSAEEQAAEITNREDEASRDAISKNISAQKDESAGQSGVEEGKEPTKAFRKGLVFAREDPTEDSPLEDEATHDSSSPGDAPAVQSGTETKDIPDVIDKSPEATENTQSVSTKEQESAPKLASESAETPKEEPTDHPELSSTESKEGLQESSEVPKSEKAVDQTEVPSQLEADATPASGADSKHDEASNTISPSANDSTEANDALPASAAGQKLESEENSAGKTPLEPTTIEDSPIELKDTTETTDKTSDPSSAETGPDADAPDAAEAPEADAATEKQPTQEEIEKAADAAKAAARLQSTADSLWAQARAVRDPAERERLWRAAYNKEVEAHGQSKKARAMASGWGQGALSGVGISSVVGVGLGNVVGALLSGVVSVPGSLIGAGVGAAIGPLVKLGGYGRSKEEKKSEEKEKDRPKEFDWEEDLSDDEEHRKIVDAVRMDEETAEEDTKVEANS